jgi:RimJ/RimL family protein N-acetyltransferase
VTEVQSPAPGRPTVKLLPLSAEAFAALADGDLETAQQLSPVPLSTYIAGPDWRPVWRRRARQLNDSPTDASWVTQIVWDPDRQVAVGRAGFHGPPDEDGMVEIGYAVDPAWRRRGYARAALAALLDRARQEPAVQTVRLSIGPGNTLSRRLAVQHGFTQVDEQQDDEDGLELVYELPVGATA